ncbi:hypothetical protein KBB08_03270 [Candidatus Gracilibacteria bacterium]|nr:hypothetical protein [Candidatus Gracilibacteria bacterium]
MTSYSQNLILGIGCGVLDYIQVVDHFPRQNTKIHSRQAELQGGGSAMNALAALARWQAKTVAFTAVGDDAIGTQIVDSLQIEGIDISVVQRVSGRMSSLSSVFLHNSMRTVVGHYELEESLQAKSLPETIWPQVQLVHLDGHHGAAALEVARIAKKHGAVVSLDGSHVFESTKKLLNDVDILIASESFAADLGIGGSPEQQIKILKSQYPFKVLAITLGGKGVIYINESGEVEMAPAFKVPVVDTNGAGDAFHAGFLYAHLHNQSRSDAVKFGQAAAALKVQSFGARKGIPTLEMIEHFLQQYA